MSIVHGGLTRNVCRAVTFDCEGHASYVGKATRKKITVVLLQGLNNPSPQRSLFSFPAFYPTWWFASLSCIIALSILSGSPHLNIGAQL